jgi:hypothetical protein
LPLTGVVHVVFIIMMLLSPPPSIEFYTNFEWGVVSPILAQKAALKYLAPYIFRVALSNRRLVQLANDQVTFRYKDARSGQSKFCTLPVLTFIQRFLQHTLPRGFVKVRYYGLFAPGNRKALPALSQLILPASSPSSLSVLPSPATANPILSADDPLRCPACGHIMQLRLTLQPVSRPPP